MLLENGDAARRVSMNNIFIIYYFITFTVEAPLAPVKLMR